MDWLKQNGISYLQKYKYVALVLLFGILLMVLPNRTETAQPTEPPRQVQPDLQSSLTQILSRVEGAGRVEVLLTEQAGAETLYQTNEDISQSEGSRDIRRDTVLIMGADREERGLIRQVISPKYLGAVVLCQGADRAQVRLELVEAVRSATGLRSDQITVLKMK